MAARKEKKNSKSRIRLYRRTVQVLVALSFIGIPWLNSKHISFVYGNFLSFNLAGFPLADPLAVLQIFLKNYYISMDLIIGALVALGLAMILGAVFCSWICPYGLLSDIAQNISRSWIRRKTYSPAGGLAIKIKILIFVAGFVGLFFFSTTPVLNQLSLPAWYSRIFQFVFVQQFLSLAILFILVVLMLEIRLKQKVWCRYICPQSLLLILFKQINPYRMKVGFDTERCYHPRNGNEPCVRTCNMGLDPKRLSKGIETGCTNCGDCIVTCSSHGKALNFSFKGKK